jgi:hypothetical protein
VCRTGPTHSAERPWHDVVESEWREYLPPDGRDPQWPAYCRCGYQFGRDDWRFVVPERLYRSGSYLPLVVLRDAPVGAIWEADPPIYASDEGSSLVIQTPAGEWWVDGPCRDGPGWTRTGTVADLTIQPGCRLHTWHGYVMAGRLYTWEPGA